MLDQDTARALYVQPSKVRIQFSAARLAKIQATNKH